LTTLVSQTLETELVQEIRFNLSTRLHLGAMIPYLFMFNSPDGVFTFNLLKGVQTIFSKSFTCADIRASLSTMDDYAHVFYPIIPDDLIQIENGLYTFKLTASGYTNTQASFLGWIQQHENIQNEMDYIPKNDEANSFAIRFKEYKEGIQ